MGGGRAKLMDCFTLITAAANEYFVTRACALSFDKVPLRRCDLMYENFVSVSDLIVYYSVDSHLLYR